MESLSESGSEPEQESKSKPSEDVAAGTSEDPYMEHPDYPGGATKADALALLAESYLAHGPGKLSGGDRHLVVVHEVSQTVSSDPDTVIDLNDRLGLFIDAQTGAGHWQGERMDDGIAVTSLWHRTHTLNGERSV